MFIKNNLKVLLLACVLLSLALNVTGKASSDFNLSVGETGQQQQSELPDLTIATVVALGFVGLAVVDDAAQNDDALYQSAAINTAKMSAAPVVDSYQ